MSEHTLKDKRALVTGGASGIGAAAVHTLAQRGAHVIVADIDPEAAESVAQEVGGESWAVDLTETSALADLSLDVDILVNNAGIQKVAPIQDFDPADFHRILMLMLESPFLLIRAALPHMYEQGWGRVINVSSIHGLRASAFKSAYVAAKHGLEGLSKTVALEGAPHGVTSNCVNPSYVRTPLVDRQIKDQAATHGIPEDEVIEKIMLTESAVKRLVEPEEVGELIAFLAGPSAGMVTGAAYTMDGGWTAS
ncbi:3-hydroxybutyrate dehydrogenase [Kocuria sp. JC486]|uniref:3-hydroxybutyrate dehydrogenase n=1 Tax=Kocuria sp. JC486 TaxID=1970736 RepID=UPI001423E153|nr:3-hydroxybutyrate dehydrogenase [Kocuria sp. JC486]NHU84860.1 3-hydroxybutyrate dehydrogenase [Kocuria sp. JC486]